MSKARLQAALNALTEISTQQYRAEVGDRFVTSLYVSPELIEREIMSEIAFVRPTKRGDVPKPIKDNAKQLAQECYNNILAKARNSGIVSVEPYGSNGSVITADGSGSNFKAIYEVTKSATGLLKNRINRLLEKVNFDPIKDNIFDIGHNEGSNADIQIGQAFARAINDTPTKQFLATLPLPEIKHISEIASSFSKNGDKRFVVQTILEAKGPNRAKNEALFRKIFLSEARKFIDNNDWANQESSDSYLDTVRKELINAGVRKKGRAKKETINRTSSRATKTDTIKGKGGKVEPFDPDLTTGIKKKSQGSYISMINLINARLPPAIRANMTGPRLHNKTGRFSESAKVISITETPQGYPRLNYTYQRSPYDVFDPVLGKAPWNTPGRDPKALIERSIRDIAKDLAIGRFYVKRAT